MTTVDEATEQYQRVVGLVYRELLHQEHSHTRAQEILADFGVPEALRRTLSPLPESHPNPSDLKAVLRYCKDQVWDAVRLESCNEAAG